jgi:preprotein translocase subunit SecA
VIGLGHQTNRRKDDQVIGRAGRQGQRGSSQFYVSPADRVFTYLPARIVRSLCERSATDDMSRLSISLRHAWSRAVTQAQDAAEALARRERKENTELDKVVQKEREALEELAESVRCHPHPGRLLASWRATSPSAETLAEIERLERRVERQPGIGGVGLETHRRHLILRALNQAWVEYQDSLADVRAATQLRAYGQKDPVREFVREAATLFTSLMSGVMEALAEADVASLKSLAGVPSGDADVTDPSEPGTRPSGQLER